MPTTLERTKTPFRRSAVFTAEIRAMDEGSKTVSAMVSTVSADRHGSIILPSAWRLEQYRKNPVVIWGHSWDGGPEAAIGICQELDAVQGKGLQAEIQYAVEANPNAELVWKLMQAGVLRAYSPGFYVHDWVDQMDLQDERMAEKVAALPDYARNALVTGQVWEVITDAELLELSNVLIGSNPDALAEAVQSGVVPRELAGRALEELGLDERSAMLRRLASRTRPRATTLSAGRKEENMDTITPAAEARTPEQAPVQRATEPAEAAPTATEARDLEQRVAGMEQRLDQVLAALKGLQANVPEAPSERDLEAEAERITDEIMAELAE